MFHLDDDRHGHNHHSWEAGGGACKPANFNCPLKKTGNDACEYARKSQIPNPEKY